MLGDKIRNVEIDDKHYLGDIYRNIGWIRLTLFHFERNSFGGSTSWPVAEVDVVDHPSMDGCNAHQEIKISFRNDIKRSRHGIDVDGNKKHLRHPKDLIDTSVVGHAVEKLKEIGVVGQPLAVYVYMRHDEDFWVEGDFWANDQ